MGSKSITIVSILSVFFAQCNQPRENANTVDSVSTSNIAMPGKPVHYHAFMMKDSGITKLNAIYDTNEQRIILTLNRIDKEHALKTDTLIVPDDVQSDINLYSPFPLNLHFLDSVSKIIFFSYPEEAFAAYKYGKLVRWGATNMGRKKDPTPLGLTYVNWKKLIDTSSVKDEWILKWNVNIFNEGGVGFHEYDMPGYPASHSCMRLSAFDAEYLYGWVDEWIMDGDNKIVAHGTPVIIFGNYPFGSPKPWRALLQNPKALYISTNELQSLVKPNLQQIINEQQKLKAVLTAKK
jgi:hypothetical protein